jgi:hypothetical protein
MEVERQMEGRWRADGEHMEGRGMCFLGFHMKASVGSHLGCAEDVASPQFLHGNIADEADAVGAHLV